MSMDVNIYRNAERNNRADAERKVADVCSHTLSLKRKSLERSREMTQHYYDLDRNHLPTYFCVQRSLTSMCCSAFTKKKKEKRAGRGCVCVCYVREL